MGRRISSRPAPGTVAPRRGFGAVLDGQVRLLVLGSFPSPVSLAARQYYAHPSNQFWPIVGAILREPLASLAYEERLQRLLAHHVGLWDVFATCRRAGSQDSRIEAARSNPLGRLRQRAPALEAVAFNGTAAGRLQPALASLGYRCAILPSTSAAHASQRLEDKLAIWKAFFLNWC